MRLFVHFLHVKSNARRVRIKYVQNMFIKFYIEIEKITSSMKNTLREAALMFLCKLEKSWPIPEPLEASVSLSESRFNVVNASALYETLRGTVQ